MKIIIILIIICMCALGVVGAMGFFTNGFSNFNKENMKEQLNSLKESVQDLTDKVGEAFKKDGEVKAAKCPHENIDENGVCQDCGTCTHKYVFNGECQGCHKSIDEIRANCEHEFDGCVCTKCGYEDHDVDPDTFQCHKCGMLIINTNSVCLNGHADKNGDGKCDYCGATVQVEQEPEPQPQEKYLVRIHQQNVPTYQVGDDVIPGDISIMLVYSDDTYDFASPSSLEVDTSTPGEYTGKAYYGEFVCEFSYTIEGTLEGPSVSGEGMLEEDGEF